MMLAQGDTDLCIGGTRRPRRCCAPAASSASPKGMKTVSSIMFTDFAPTTARARFCRLRRGAAADPSSLADIAIAG